MAYVDEEFHFTMWFCFENYLRGEAACQVLSIFFGFSVQKETITVTFPVLDNRCFLK